MNQKDKRRKSDEGRPCNYKDLRNIPLIRRVLDENEFFIYITNDEQFQHLTNGEKALEPVSFPRKDVFQYDPELASLMDRLYKSGKWDWNKLLPF